MSDKGAPDPLRLSCSIMRAAEEMAAREGVSLNQQVATAPAEEPSALRTEDLPAERAAGGDRDRARDPRPRRHRAAARGR